MLDQNLYETEYYTFFTPLRLHHIPVSIKCTILSDALINVLTWQMMSTQ